MRLRALGFLPLILLAGMALLLCVRDGGSSRRSPARSRPRQAPPLSTIDFDRDEPIRGLEPVGNSRATETVSQAPERDSFAERVGELAAERTKHGYRMLLLDWRSGRTTPEEDRIIEESIFEEERSEDLATAAGRLLLEKPIEEAQVQAWCAILAADGSSSAIEFLAAATAEPKSRPAALEHLATVANPEGIGTLSRLLRAGADWELQEAAALALTRIDTDEAHAVLESHPIGRVPRRSP